MSISENHSKENLNTKLDHPKLYIGLARQYAQYEPPKYKTISVVDGSERTCGTEEAFSHDMSVDAICREYILKMILWAKGIESGIYEGAAESMSFVRDCLGMNRCSVGFIAETSKEFNIFEEATPEEVEEVREFIVELQRRILESKDYLWSLITGEEDVVISMIKHNIDRYYRGELNADYILDLLRDNCDKVGIRDEYIYDTYQKLMDMRHSN